ncbi:MAG TPA: hypothetical protein VK348_11985 [Planctomycetota bacterium]|nr:hypothetical protein [Planctomycetota bacterium]
MTYDPRTIAFHAEILYPPQQLRADVVQGIHNSLYKQPPLSYQNFQVAADGIHLTNLPQTPGMISIVTFLPDRMVLREEFRATTIEDFAMRVVEVASISFQALGIGTSLAQQFVVRSLVSPRHVRDGRELLAQRMVHDPEQGWRGFGRPLQSVGLHLSFPPTENQRENYQVRLETWHQDPRSVWIENTGVFAMPTASENLPNLGNYLLATYRFLTGPIGDYLARFDQPQP